MAGDVAYVAYGLDPTFIQISRRFRDLHGIDVRSHVHRMLKVNRRLEEGFDFEPKSVGLWTQALIGAGFQRDQRDWHLGLIPSVGLIAAGATHGEGFREEGSPSLHCAVAADRCNIHLDNVGFRLKGYGPDAPQHIVDELIWQDKIVRPLRRILPSFATNFLHRLHPVVPNSRQMTPFGAVGVEFDVASGRSANLQQSWRLTIDVTHSCKNSTCDALRALDGRKLEGDNRLLLTIKVLGM
ncbi:MAG: hypothetical protein IPM64_11150 [Phycisphaerales bacterium]|nr:hypothetical protein [Phycisphaerales bacterium]